MVIKKIDNGLAQNSTYISKYGKTVSGNLRGGSMKDTYEAYFYLNKNKKIIGLKSDKINKGNLIGEKSNFKIKMGIGNIVIHILESGKNPDYYKDIYSASFNKDKKYETINELLNELNIAYEYKIGKILSK